MMARRPDGGEAEKPLAFSRRAALSGLGAAAAALAPSSAVADVDSTKRGPELAAEAALAAKEAGKQATVGYYEAQAKLLDNLAQIDQQTGVTAVGSSSLSKAANSFKPGFAKLLQNSGLTDADSVYGQVGESGSGGVAVWLAGWLAGWLPACLPACLPAWLAGWLAAWHGWLAGWLAAWLPACLFG